MRHLLVLLSAFALFRVGFSFLSSRLYRGGSLKTVNAASANRLPASSTELPMSSKMHSFVQDELRPYAIKLHSKDQAKGGQQDAQVPYGKWEPTRADYLRFLVDSLHVFETLEDQVETIPALHTLRNNGLERAPALREDVEWMLNYDRSLQLPGVGPAGAHYGQLLQDLAQTNLPAFVCHHYNQYFAQSAGGLRIGNAMAAKLLGGRRLRFHSWPVPEVGSAGRSALTEGVESTVGAKEGAAAGTGGGGGGGDGAGLFGSRQEAQYVEARKEELRARIDALAEGWTPAQRQACCEESLQCFRYGHTLLDYLRGRSATAVEEKATAEALAHRVGGGVHVAPIQ